MNNEFMARAVTELDDGLIAGAHTFSKKAVSAVLPQGFLPPPLVSRLCFAPCSLSSLPKELKSA